MWRKVERQSHTNLPWYRGHNCLTDAVATAELLIAMVATREQHEKTTLADLY